MVASLILALAILMSSTLGVVDHPPEPVSHTHPAASMAPDHQSARSMTEDSGETSGTRSDHAGSHNPFDHSHDPSFASASALHGNPIYPDVWQAARPAQLDGRFANWLDRPPDSFS